MGRQIKRVSLDFEWPLNVPWKGYQNPYTKRSCLACHGSGSNPATRELRRTWWGTYPQEGWRFDLIQDEVDALVAQERLLELTHDFEACRGWVPKDPMPQITPEQVNQWARDGLGYDGSDAGICVEVRAKRLGVYGACVVCGGEGILWYSDDFKRLSKAWDETGGYEPPVGEGWQVWETVSEGSPVSPVCASAGELVAWLVAEEGVSQEAAEAFVQEDNWVPTMVVADGRVYRGIETIIPCRVGLADSLKEEEGA